MGLHKHCCPDCFHVWEHQDTMRGNREAHTCIKCGSQCWLHYHGDAPAAECNTQKNEERQKLLRDIIELLSRL